MTVPATHRDDFLEFCEGIRRLTGIDLTQYKRGQMERRIRSLAERRGIGELPAYLAALSADAGRLEEFLDRVTINVSQLWRNPEQFQRLADEILPRLAESGRIRCWSAGCSYGAEAYTVAALCKTVAPAARIEVHGHDIDARMIERARAGRFSAADARSAPGAGLERWFVRLPDGDWEAKPELKLVTRFSTGDLLHDRFPAGHYDLVLCRNVVIYFTEEVRDALHARLAASVRPGGYLMIGSTERVAEPASMGLRPAFPFVYQKAAV
jgi:chemotaxis protein methyltransferase CheR